jgi:hypothetical protein
VFPFSLTAQLPDQDISGDEETRLGAAHIQISCLIIYVFLCIIDSRRPDIRL